MTCDQQMLYLVGGTDSNKYVQGYDHRTSEWIALTPTSGIYEMAACCFSKGKIYVSGGFDNPKSVERYDPVAAKWENMPDMNQCMRNHEMLVDELDECVTYNKFLLPGVEEDVFYVSNEWSSSLYSDIMKSNLLHGGKLEVVHMTSFKLYGL